MWVDNLRRISDQGKGHSVDREISTGQVVLKTAGGHFWKRTRRRVALFPGGDHIHTVVFNIDSGGPESRMHDHLARQFLCHLCR